MEYIANSRKPIGMIIPYFGEKPAWFDFFLLSCSKNQSFDWLFFTDCLTTKRLFGNIHFIKMTLNEFSKLASKNLNINVDIKFPYKLCDFKPAYGLIFSDYILGYKYWGYCDIDIIYGDINSFIPADFYETYDIFSPNIEFLPGHFCILKNTIEITNLFSSALKFKKILVSERYHYFDEFYFKKGAVLSADAYKKHLRKRINKHIIFRVIKYNTIFSFCKRIYKSLSKNSKITLSPVLNDFNQIVKYYSSNNMLKILKKNVYRDDIMKLSVRKKRWIIKWENGKLFLNGQEIMYYHFQLLKYMHKFEITKTSEYSFRITI